MARSMLRVGEVVGERYRVDEPLATGGMGTLWRAHHLELAVDVALKVLTTDMASPELLRRFKREAQASARLRSPHIVKVLDYGVHESQPYLAMELLRGEDLATRLERETKLPLEQARAIARSVAEAMQIAHDAGIVHRDLKPANIFLERVGETDVVKVLDFGVAKDLRANEAKGATTGASVVGSPSYMSPEQVWGEGVDHRSDIWAMGVVCFEMLTGVCPFDDATLAKVFEKIVRAPLPLVRAYDATLPASVEAFLTKAVARDREERWSSAKDFAAAFDEAVAQNDLGSAVTVYPSSSRSIRIVPPSAPSPDAAPGRRRTRTVILAAVAAAAVASVGGAFLRKGGAPLEPHDAMAMTPSAAPLAVSIAAPPALPEPVASTSAHGGTQPISASPLPSASATPRAPSWAGRGRPSATSNPPPAPSVDPTFGVPVTH